jgi:hypothetical protein
MRLAAAAVREITPPANRAKQVFSPAASACTLAPGLLPRCSRLRGITGVLAYQGRPPGSAGVAVEV